MSHKLVLDVPNEVYDPLVASARRSGATPEELAVAWLTVASRQAVTDPVEKFIGALPSGTVDWTDQHDKYLGEALMQRNDPSGPES